jgi:hypothetical protein
MDAEKLAVALKVEIKYVTKGEKLYNTIINPFDVKDYKIIYCDILKTYGLIASRLEIIRNFVLICDGYYVNLTLTNKSKCAGAFWYFIQAWGLVYSIEEVENITEVKKNTIFKAFDNIIIYINAKRIKNPAPVAIENFENRYNELRRYLTENKTKIIDIKFEKRFKKYYNYYDF